MEDLSIFSERLREYVGEERPSELAQMLGIARSTMFELMRGSFLPSTRVLILLVEHFACSSDYLLGLAELPKEGAFLPVLPFGGRLREALKVFSVTQYRLEKDLKISGSTVYAWLTDRAIPSVASLIHLSQYFGCSVDFLLGRER